MLIYPHFDPVALRLGPFAIRWYALAYLTGILSGWWLVAKLNRRLEPPTLSKQAFDDLMVYAVFGIILGGRLGYVLFYKPAFYFTHPLQIPMIWQGGMSFHGGLVGTLGAMALFARRYRVRFLAVTDLLAVAAPIGLCLGRLANFINAELYGRVTDSPLGMVFPGGGPLPRHPSQLYEAGLEGVFLFLILLGIAFFTGALALRGRLSGCFLFFREPDVFLGFFFQQMVPGGVTMGQLLCLPMLLIGFWLSGRARPSPDVRMVVTTR
jgi:phosphatidylglycerol:prolipoprotein diacylglycerol transferase